MMTRINQRWKLCVMWHICKTCDVTPGPVWENVYASSFWMSPFEKRPVMIIQDSGDMTHSCDTARSREDETRNGERNPNPSRNPEWWGDFSHLVKIEKIKFLGISRNKVELRFWLDLNSAVSRGTNSNWDFCLIWICSWLKSFHHSGLWFAFRWPFRVSSSRERAVHDPCMWQDSFVSVNLKWLIHMWDITHSYHMKSSVRIIQGSESALYPNMGWLRLVGFLKL